MEIWKPVLKGVFQVSDVGRVRETVSGRIFRSTVGWQGYHFVQPYREGVQRRYRVHRLVAAAFIGECPPEKEVNHMDGNKSNNSPSNLEYVSHLDNMRHASRMKLMRGCKGAANGRAKLSELSVRKIRTSYPNENTVHLGRKYGVSNVLIGLIVRNEIWTHI